MWNASLIYFLFSFLHHYWLKHILSYMTQPSNSFTEYNSWQRIFMLIFVFHSTKYEFRLTNNTYLEMLHSGLYPTHLFIYWRLQWSLLCCIFCSNFSPSNPIYLSGNKIRWGRLSFYDDLLHSDDSVNVYAIWSNATSLFLYYVLLHYSLSLSLCQLFYASKFGKYMNTSVL